MHNGAIIKIIVFFFIYMKAKKLFAAENNELVSLEKKVRLSARDCILFNGADITNETCSLSDSELLAAVYGADENPDAKKNTLLALCLPFESLCAENNSYNEAFLSNIRSFLKKLEAQSVFVFIMPKFSASENFAKQNEAFIHAARRIKDCSNAVGFAIPSEICHNDAVAFKNSFFEKHPFYIFFVDEKNETIERGENIISYNLIEQSGVKNEI